MNATVGERSLAAGSRHAGVVVGAVIGSDGRTTALQVQLAGGPLLLVGAPALPPGTRIALQITSVQPLQAVLHQTGAPSPATAASIPAVVLSTSLSASAVPGAVPGAVGRSTTAPGMSVSGMGVPVGPEGSELTASTAGAIAPVPATATPAGTCPGAATLPPETVLSGIARRVAATLARIRPVLPQRLKQDEAAPARAAERASDGGWNAVSIPLLPGIAVTSVRLLFRQPDTGGKARCDATGTGDRRFVIDLALDNLGPLQLDTTVHGVASTNPGWQRQLDVVLRSARPLPVPERDALRTLVHAASARHGLAGTLGFHAGSGDFLETVGRQGDRSGIVV